MATHQHQHQHQHQQLVTTAIYAASFDLLACLLTCLRAVCLFVLFIRSSFFLLSATSKSHDYIHTSLPSFCPGT